MPSRIQQEFLDVLLPQIDEFFENLLTHEPQWDKESILEDETGDVYGELLSILIDCLKEEGS